MKGLIFVCSWIAVSLRSFDRLYQNSKERILQFLCTYYAFFIGFYIISAGNLPNKFQMELNFAYLMILSIRIDVRTWAKHVDTASTLFAIPSALLWLHYYGRVEQHCYYSNFPKFSDRQVWANSADPDQTAPRGAVWSGSTLFAIPSLSFGLSRNDWNTVEGT